MSTGAFQRMKKEIGGQNDWDEGGVPSFFSMKSQSRIRTISFIVN
jgi:hypothetical protein